MNANNEVTLHRSEILPQIEISKLKSLTVRAPESTHNALFLKNTGLYKKLMAGEGLPDEIVNLGEESGDISLVTIDDSAFPRFPCLIKLFNSNNNYLK